MAQPTCKWQIAVGAIAFVVAGVVSGIISFKLVTKSLTIEDMVDNMTPNEKVGLSDRVWLYDTGNCYITDETGFGLINGEILRLGYESDNPNMLIVEYEPYHRFRESPDDTLRIALIDLKTAKVTHDPDVDDAGIASLKDVSTYFDY